MATSRISGSLTAEAAKSKPANSLAAGSSHDSAVRIAERTAAAESEKALMTRIRNALAFLVELAMREMVLDAREYEVKALLSDLFGQRAAAATIGRLHARMSTGGPEMP